MKIENDIKLDYNNVLIRPKRSILPTRQDVNLKRKYKFLNSQQEWTGIPVMAANMSVVGTFSMARSLANHDMLTALHKHYTSKEIVDFMMSSGLRDRVFISIGATDNDMEKLREMSSMHLERTKTDEIQDAAESAFPYMLNIDVANGYTKSFHDFIRRVRDEYPYTIIMAGNVATPEMVQQLLERGADIVKIGIGPGSCCTTRLVAGVGVPQLSAVIECADAARGYRGLICADGGCNHPGDVSKAFGGGADFVMLGGMLAGTDQCEGEWIYEEIEIKPEKANKRTSSVTVWNGGSSENPSYKSKLDPENPEIEGGVTVQGGNKGRSQFIHHKNIERFKKELKFYGMSSTEAMHKYSGGVADYRAAEGKSVTVPYKGSANEVALEVLGGLRSACSYVGATRLKDLSKCCTFIRCMDTHNKVFG